MGIAGYAPLVAHRWEPCFRTLRFRGLDLTSADMQAQVRLYRDAGGSPLVNLATVTNANAEGVRLVSAEMVDGVPVSTVTLRINEATMEGLPPAAAIGDDAEFAWDMQITQGGLKQKRLYGEFVVVGGVTGADAGVIATSLPVASAGSGSQVMDAASSFTFGDVVVDVSIGEGAAILAALARKLDKAGGPVFGPLNLQGNRIENVGAPDSPDDAARFGDALAAAAQRLSIDGGSLFGLLNMQGNRVENIGAPDTFDDAARLGDIVSAVANRLIRVTSATDHEIVDDRIGVWGGGSNVLYVPRRFTTVQGAAGGQVDFTDPINPECAERAGYCRLVRSANAYDLETLIFDKTTNGFRLLPFGELATILPALGDQAVVIARFFRDEIQSDFKVRRSTDGLVPNQNPYGRSDMRRMPFLFQGTPTFAAITDPALVALGFTVGQAQTATGNDTAPLAGMAFDQTMQGGRAFFRFWAQTSAAGKWGDPIVFFWSDTGYLSQVPLRVERYLSGTARIYSGTAAIPSGATRYLVGLSPVTGATQIVTGTQHHAGDDARDIAHDDWGALARTPLIGPELFVVSGQPLPLYRRNLFVEREGLEPTVLLASSKGAPAAPMVLGEGGGDIMVDADRVGATARLLVRARNEKMFRNYREMKAYSRTVPLSAPATPSILCLGDSITNRETPEMLRRYLAAWNVTPTFIGTMKSAINQFDDNADGPLGEGREGWAAYNTYLGMDIAAQAPGGIVQPGGEAGYLALSKAERRRRQIFLNPDTAAGSAAPIVSIGGTNYRFDLAFYLSRFGFAAPAFVLLNLGMNDFFQTSDDNYRVALSAILAEVRRAMPTAQVICWQTVMPYTIDGNRATAAAYGQVRRALVETVEARMATDTKLHLVSAWAHQTAEAWELYAPAPDAAGVRSDIPTEYTHPKGVAREQHAFALACAVANLA